MGPLRLGSALPSASLQVGSGVSLGGAAGGESGLRAWKGHAGPQTPDSTQQHGGSGSIPPNLCPLLVPAHPPQTRSSWTPIPSVCEDAGAGGKPLEAPPSAFVWGPHPTTGLGGCSHGSWGGDGPGLGGEGRRQAGLYCY